MYYGIIVIYDIIAINRYNEDNGDNGVSFKLGEEIEISPVIIQEIEEEEIEEEEKDEKINLNVVNHGGFSISDINEIFKSVNREDNPFLSVIDKYS